MSKHKFIRYGALKPVKQKGFKSDSYHSAPKGKGFYAFPFGFEELFLVANLRYQKDIHNALPTVTKYEVYRSYNRNSGEYNLDFLDWECKDVWLQKRNFEVKGDREIWHHLEDYVVNKKDIIDTSKSWCKTTVDVWKKAFNKCINKQKMEHWDKGTNILETPKKGYYSNDHLEVFMDFKV